MTSWHLRLGFTIQWCICTAHISLQPSSTVIVTYRIPFNKISYSHVSSTLASNITGTITTSPTNFTITLTSQYYYIVPTTLLPSYSPFRDHHPLLTSQSQWVWYIVCLKIYLIWFEWSECEESICADGCLKAVTHIWITEHFHNHFLENPRMFTLSPLQKSV